jgi:nucleoside-triphosphatase THEP1
VEPGRLVPLNEEELVRPPGAVDAYLIDGIARIECQCPQFIWSMRTLLDGPVPLVATVAFRGGAFIAEAKRRPGVRIVEVTQGNRQDLPGLIAAWVKQRTSETNTL